MAAKKKPVKKAPAKKAAKKAPAKKAAKKAPAKKAKPAKAAKKAKPAKKEKPKTKRKPNEAFMRPVTPDEVLAAVVGSKPIPRTEIVKKLWDYIKKNGLQDKKNKRAINADETLRPLFGKDQITMFDLAKIVSKHLA